MRKGVGKQITRRVQAVCTCLEKDLEGCMLNCCGCLSQGNLIMKTFVFLFAHHYLVRNFYNEQVLLPQAEKNNEYVKKECSVYDGSLRSTVFVEHKIGGGTAQSRGENPGSCGMSPGPGEGVGLALAPGSGWSAH